MAIQVGNAFDDIQVDEYLAGGDHAGNSLHAKMQGVSIDSLPTYLESDDEQFREDSDDDDALSSTSVTTFDGFEDGYNDFCLSEGRGWQTSIAEYSWHGPYSPLHMTECVDGSSTVNSCGGVTASVSVANIRCFAPAVPRDEDVQDEWKGVTTVMLRNFPHKITQQMVLDDLIANEFDGTFDFLYVPIDAKTKLNRGYAFINFVNPGLAWKCKLCYDGGSTVPWIAESSRRLKVTPATFQGFEASHAHYTSSRIGREDPQSREPGPLFLSVPLRAEAITKLSAPRVPSQAETTSKLSAPRNVNPKKGGRRHSLIDAAARNQANKHVPGHVNSIRSGHSTTVQCGTVTSCRFCPHCGGPVRLHFKFCQLCGSSLALRS